MSCLVIYAQKANGKYDTNKKIVTRKSLSQSTFSLTSNPLHSLFHPFALFAFFLQTKAAEQYFLPLGLFIIWLFKAVLIVTIQMKATEQYFPLTPCDQTVGFLQLNTAKFSKIIIIIIIQKIGFDGRLKENRPLK